MLADPAPGDDGNDDRGAARDGTLVAWDDAAASAVTATGGLRHATSGYAGTASDPWTGLSSRHGMRHALRRDRAGKRRPGCPHAPRRGCAAAPT